MSEIKVEYVDHMGTDLTIVNAARVSFGNNKIVLEEKDKKLIKYLADHKHMSPFEHCQLSVKISCPLFIRSQIHRHRTFAYNEISRRYTSKDLEFYKPKIYRNQSTDNRQASYGAIDEETQKVVEAEVEEIEQSCLGMYEALLSMGVCREQARGILPQNLMTEFYMTGNLRNWAHFVNLRLHPGAQGEVQEIAQKCKELLKQSFGYSAEVLFDQEGDH